MLKITAIMTGLVAVGFVAGYNFTRAGLTAVLKPSMPGGR
jgi:hypothetical protein